jgi:hypothetical protein
LQAASAFPKDIDGQFHLQISPEREYISARPPDAIAAVAPVVARAPCPYREFLHFEAIDRFSNAPRGTKELTVSAKYVFFV